MSEERSDEDRDATGELVESLERATEARDAFKDERNGAVAEVRSLRGVVQAAREFIAVSDTTAPMDGSGTDVVMTREDFNRLTLAEDALAAALAAAADAPQPATCNHGKTKAHQMTDTLGVYANCPGPVSHE